MLTNNSLLSCWSSFFCSKFSSSYPGKHLYDLSQDLWTGEEKEVIQEPEEIIQAPEFLECSEHSEGLEGPGHKEGSEGSEGSDGLEGSEGSEDSDYQEVTGGLEGS